MANTFSLILVLVTLFTGIIWALDKFVWVPRRQLKAAEVLQLESGEVSEEQVAQVAPQPSWIETSASVFPVIGLVLVLRSFIYEPFQIPSGSMMPTLLVGDFILVEKFAYGLKDPVFRHQLVETGEPERGDVVVFKYPPQPSIDFIKRVVGVPGDTVRYTEDKRLCIKKEGESTCEFVPVDNVHQSGFTQRGVNLIQAEEILGQEPHEILVNPYIPNQTGQYYPTPGLGEWVVPEGQYFVMGDNRDNSKDSRFWGFVPEENLVGKAVGIWISFEFDEQGDSFLPSWVPVGVRFDRIGGID
ncbi:signal peptidase I [Enterovibrio nigricans]|uniref:Signal peptidase I n=1 Tax=Enterovibrio nigricans DSM 22720 TaxID=1121868 RepID=A0A1T4TZ21_9GAMM|nr:signal peptidase I [Enterovibrio nigricans]PKF51653.1 signal peptidase I [Enterovibrio nigricans]SKA45683.1 signal peptidase I [Enterovibrio nigricans DSM 22720]